jgi:hypothetical protein
MLLQSVTGFIKVFSFASDFPNSEHGAQYNASFKTEYLSHLNFLQITSDSKPSISVSLESSRAKQVEINKHILRKIIENLILCGRQNIAIRGEY